MFKNINNAEFTELVEEGNVTVIDVRTPNEVNDGHIGAAQHFIDINNEPFEARIQELDKSKNYIVYCRSGARSARACSIMAGNGFTGKLYNLANGILGWDGDLKTN